MEHSSDTMAMQGPDPEGRGDGRHLFPDGKQWKKPSDYRPSPEDKNRTADIRILRDRSLGRVPYVAYTFFFRLPGDKIQRWACFTTRWLSAVDGFRKMAATLDVPVSLAEIKRRPFRPTGYDRPDKPDRRKSQVPLDPETEVSDELTRYIRNQAAKLARGNIDLADDLFQEALIRVCKTPAVARRRDEAIRAMRAFLKLEKRWHRWDASQYLETETF